MASSTEVHEEENPEVVNLNDSQVEKIEAELVRVSRSYVKSADSEETEMYQVAAMNVNSNQLHANSSILGIVQDQSSVIENSIFLASKASNLQTSNSITGGIIAENATIGQDSKVGILVSGEVSSEKINTFLLVARHVEGTVETSLNTQQVALAGILAGIASGAVILLGKYLLRRK